MGNFALMLKGANVGLYTEWKIKLDMGFKSPNAVLFFEELRVLERTEAHREART